MTHLVMAKSTNTLEGTEMVYYTTNTVMYDGKTGLCTKPTVLYNKVKRYQQFPMLNNSAFNLVELKRGETMRIDGELYPKPGVPIRVVSR